MGRLTSVKMRIPRMRLGGSALVMAMTFAFSFPLMGGEPGVPAEEPQNGTCLRCHGMPTLGYQDPDSGKFINFYVDHEKFSRSDHGRQGCVVCHKGNFTVLPHQPEGGRNHHSCGDCHTGEKLVQRMRLVGIAAQFQKSVHVQRKVKGFDCFSCHNPHESRLENRMRAETDVVRRDNGVCLNCHQEMMAVEEKHQVIPKTGMHLAAVRCLDCHTPRPGSVIHAIEPAQRAERNCVACHSRDSILLTKLYKYRLHESEQRAGFINGVVLSDYYVIGMTRHPLLDALGILGVGGALLGVLIHGAGRWFATRRRLKP
ncbi:MAG: hypothetical protein HQL85_03180 [Magnetococcales bacterium]|nr:hypothetical protein [Magnetococcales bacterium]MBF0348922.1 hypothetical protein [Magnetococcales bacterium]